jgi:hypothetical protein
MIANAIIQGIKSAGNEELEEISALALAELEERRRKRREEAMAEIRRIAGAEHISVKFDGKPKKNARTPLYRSGRHYQHPTDKALLWTAKGQKPNWVRALEAEGRRPVEIPAEAANDIVPSSLKKTG